jgi:hypothetical protein
VKAAASNLDLFATNTNYNKGHQLRHYILAFRLQKHLE